MASSIFTGMFYRVKPIRRGNKTYYALYGEERFRVGGRVKSKSYFIRMVGAAMLQLGGHFLRKSVDGTYDRKGKGRTKSNGPTSQQAIHGTYTGSHGILTRDGWAATRSTMSEFEWQMYVAEMKAAKADGLKGEKAGKAARETWGKSVSEHAAAKTESAPEKEAQTDGGEGGKSG